MQPAGSAGELIDAQEQAGVGVGHSVSSSIVVIGSSKLVQSGKHPLGVVGQPLAAVLESLFGVGGQGCAEQVAALNGAMPAAEPLQALFLFLQFRQGEL